MKKRKICLMLVCLFGILIAMSGCNASSIEGNWYENSNPDKNRIEFKDEGKAMFMANGYSDEITYSLSEDKKTVYLEREGILFDKSCRLAVSYTHLQPGKQDMDDRGELSNLMNRAQQDYAQTRCV